MLHVGDCSCVLMFSLGADNMQASMQLLLSLVLCMRLFVCQSLYLGVDRAGVRFLNNGVFVCCVCCAELTLTTCCFCLSCFAFCTLQRRCLCWCPVKQQNNNTAQHNTTQLVFFICFHIIRLPHAFMHCCCVCVCVAFSGISSDCYHCMQPPLFLGCFQTVHAM